MTVRNRSPEKKLTKLRKIIDEGRMLVINHGSDFSPQEVAKQVKLTPAAYRVVLK